ncbi:hypothetical protein OWV82_024186 [Melia azedarach]|uniref:Uncharacterized protein n=1 Tax=Melia azedarach TaxID=155640 RepID=A0ACC1WP90_MELAZ|nr:hypothetical protein OWV82_024186 [Melia azedarach]
MTTQQPANNFPGTKNLSVEEINSARAKAAMKVFMRWNKEAAAAQATGRADQGSSITKTKEEIEIELNLKNLKVN